MLNEPYTSLLVDNHFSFLMTVSSASSISAVLSYSLLRNYSG